MTTLPADHRDRILKAIDDLTEQLDETQACLEVRGGRLADMRRRADEMDDAITMAECQIERLQNLEANRDEAGRQACMEAGFWNAKYNALAARLRDLHDLLESGRGHAARDEISLLLTDAARLPSPEQGEALHASIEEFCEDHEILLADGFDAAFIGIAYRACSEPVACYDYDHCILIVQANGVPDPADAEDFFHYNTLGSYVGPTTPVFVQRMPR